MATKNTVYLIKVDRETYLIDPRYAAVLWPLQRHEYAFSGDRRRAQRFTGRVAAMTRAAELARQMAAKGYPGVLIQVVPATGGHPVGG